MKVELIPAVDLKQGECVRLLKGQKDQSTRYSDDPISVARYWEDKGANRLHVVDLDGAFEERSPNREIIESIIETVPIPCQVGGGLRSRTSVSRVLRAGADAAVVGTAGIKDPQFLTKLIEKFGRESIIAAVDCRNGKVLVQGWEEESQYSRDEWVDRLETIGVKQLIYTDVSRDGTQRGPDVSGTKELLNNFSIDVVASGGIGSLDHLRNLREISTPQLKGVIVGRALYERSFTYEAARRVLT